MVEMRARSEPPPSVTFCTERTHLARLAVNVEQLLHRSPGGIGRYAVQLATIMPRLYPDDELITFVARHPKERIDSAMGASGAKGVSPVALPWPRPLLYESWVRWGMPPLRWGAEVLGTVDLVHAPSLAVPPRGRT